MEPGCGSTPVAFIIVGSINWADDICVMAPRSSKNIVDVQTGRIDHGHFGSLNTKCKLSFGILKNLLELNHKIQDEKNYMKRRLDATSSKRSNKRFYTKEMHRQPTKTRFHYT
ncbi:hypothetical protein PoB_004326300 [Plakobranchus ocellatus]|uniref:Uncharacterized protein n=1 Tax=Plakobranchus ocellatus TaxID=259542 RepID=A0AAV4BC77_9GAST|nr:hypothetical protein PoB_004326300 [Plakobranchus ocellatus]